MNCGKVKKFLFEPSKAFNEEKKSELGKAGTYMLKVAFVTAILSAIIAGVVGGAFGAVAAVTTFIGVYIGIFIGFSIWGLWLHLWILVMGGKGLHNTLKAIYYGNTPYYLLGWIPALFTIPALFLFGSIGALISVLIFLWSLVLTAVGLTKLHNMTGGRVAGAIIIAIVIPLAIALLLFITFLMAFMGMGGAIDTSLLPGISY